MMLIEIAGIAMFGVITATIAAYFVEQKPRRTWPAGWTRSWSGWTVSKSGCGPARTSTPLSTCAAEPWSLLRTPGKVHVAGPPGAVATVRRLEEASRVLTTGERGALQVRQPVGCPGRSTSLATWCMPPRVAGCGRQHGVAPPSQRTGCSKPQPDPGSGSNCHRVGIDTCGCCCDADAAMKRSHTMTTARIPAARSLSPAASSCDQLPDVIALTWPFGDA